MSSYDNPCIVLMTLTALGFSECYKRLSVRDFGCQISLRVNNGIIIRIFIISSLRVESLMYFLFTISSLTAVTTHFKAVSQHLP
jgi:hypothetical protein